MSVEGPDFVNDWPEISRRLRRLLASRGLQPSDAEDVVQETGLKLLVASDRIDTQVPIMPLAATVALNVVRDRARRRKKETLRDAPDVAARDDVERTSMARFEFHRAARALRSLPPQYQKVLLDLVLEDGQDRKPQVGAVKMMRSRARRKLNAMLGAASALSAWLAKRRWWQIQPSAGAMLVAALVGTAAPVSPPRAGDMWADHGKPSAGTRAHVMNLRTTPKSHLFEHKAAPTGPEPADPVGSHPRPAKASRPVRLPVPGGGEATVWARVEAGSTFVEVRETDGPVPACVGGTPPAPDALDCSPKDG
jgi:DNA-directed RNA polymerase specialized sigma24 family protein